TCFCDSSPEIALGGCIAAGATATEPVVSDDGEAMAFAVCLDPDTCRSYYWTEATGRQEIPSTGLDGAHPTGISGDEQLVLLSPRAPSLSIGSLVHPDGTFEPIPAPPVDPSAVTSWVYRVGSGVTATGLMSWLPGTNGDSRGLVKLSAAGVAVGLTWPVNGSHQLARWTEERDLEPLAPFPVEEDNSVFRDQYGWRNTVTINDMTPDGSTIVGIGGYASLLWTDAAGLQSDLGPVPATAVDIMSISRDGSTVVGGLYLGEKGPSIAFRWRRDQSSFTELGPLAGGDQRSLFVSDDGSAV